MRGRIEETRDYAERIVDTVRKPLVVLDQEFRVRIASRSFYQTFHVPQGAAENAPFFSLSGGRWDMPGLRARLEEVIERDAQFQDFQVEQEFPAVGRRIMLLNARSLSGGDPRDRMILLAVEDLTERLLAAEALRKSEERFQLVARATNDAIRDWDLLTGAVWCNESFRTAFGGGPGEASCGLEWWVGRAHPDDRPRVRRGIEELIACGDEVWSDEYRYCRQDGSYAVVFERSHVVREEGGRPVRVVSSMMDITERREGEERLKLFAAKLERSNRELQDFASVASHDLQEPLRKIQAFGDRLKLKYGGALGDEGLDYVRRMQSAAARMQALIDDLLTFSRVGSEARPFVPVDLGSIARDVLGDLEVQIERAGARIEIGELPTVEADPVQMRQLLQNLIGNSLKYRRPEVTPEVKIYSAAADGAGGDARLCRVVVEDNGIGFDEKYLERVFTVFQRLHGRTQYEGTGVGLAVCRKIAERHGGGITARSAPGRGAAFIVTLPVEQQQQEARGE